MPPGRPTKLTPEMQEKICALIASGCFEETSCESLGVAKSTFYEWQERGRLEGEGIYFEFAEACARARADFEHKSLLEIDRIAEVNGDWKALAWRLERRYPERYSAKQKTELTGKDGGPVAVSHPVIMIPKEEED